MFQFQVQIFWVDFFFNLCPVLSSNWEFNLLPGLGWRNRICVRIGVSPGAPVAFQSVCHSVSWSTIAVFSIVAAPPLEPPLIVLPPRFFWWNPWLGRQKVGVFCYSFSGASPNPAVFHAGDVWCACWWIESFIYFARGLVFFPLRSWASFCTSNLSTWVFHLAGFERCLRFRFWNLSKMSSGLVDISTFFSFPSAVSGLLNWIAFLC